MMNTVKYVSMQEVPQLKNKYQQDQDSFNFPIEAKGIDGYNDWMRDLTWTLIKTHEDINGHCYCLKSGTI